MLNPPLTYTFDDLLLVPQYSELASRKDPDISTSVGTIHGKIPIVAAPMNTVCELEMARLLDDLGGFSVIHRFMTPEEQVAIYNDLSIPDSVFMAIGILSENCEKRVKALIREGCMNFCVDVAYGNTEKSIQTVEYISAMTGPEGNVMAGNVCTAAGAEALYLAGANIIRVGIGSGSACRTRLVTGHGVPQLSAIHDICEHMDRINAPVEIVADGGIRNSGDAVKALAMGADAVMIGGLLAGTSEAPGELITNPFSGQLVKKFCGMASKEGREGWFSPQETTFVPEGESFTVPFKGSAKVILNELSDAIKDGLSYSGAKNISDLQAKAKWIRVTDNGRREGNANRKLHSS